MSDVLIISPHFDDVPLSLGQSLLDGELAERSVSVRVAFGRTNWSVQMHPTARRASVISRWRELEERLAARRFGYSLKVDSFEEVILRRGSLDPETFRGGTEARSDPLFGQIRDHLRVLGAQHDNIWVPAGLGEHIDHRLIATAAADLTVAGKANFTFYEDRPYVSYLSDAELAEQLSVLNLELGSRDVSGPIQGATQAVVRRIYRSQIDPYFVDAQSMDLERSLCERVWVASR